jgi:co-chaperonin GroES (HSP10)
VNAIELNRRLVGLGMKLLGPEVAVAREKRPEKSEGGIVLPDTAVVKIQYGAVVLVGDEVERDIIVGDQVYIPMYGGVLAKQKVKRDDGLRDDIYVLEILHQNDVKFSYRTENHIDLHAGEIAELERAGRTH